MHCKTGVVTRLGDDRKRSLDLRVIASTNRDVDREVRAGRLRQDLMLHLEVFPMLCPPLRDRRGGHPNPSSSSARYRL